MQYEDRELKIPAIMWHAKLQNYYYYIYFRLEGNVHSDADVFFLSNEAFMEVRTLLICPRLSTLGIYDNIEKK
jgi:hypothetical protein